VEEQWWLPCGLCVDACPAKALRTEKDRFVYVKFRQDQDCPVCGENPTVTKLIDYEDFV